MLKNILRPALTLLVMLSLITGIAYPLVVTGAAQLIFPRQAEGSLVRLENRVVGSSLIGQDFSDPKYFWGRPSATADKPYNGAASGGSNLGPLNPALAQAVATRVAALRKADPGNTAPIPVDLVTASASGLDPHISPAAAHAQVQRVARMRNMDVAKLQALVDASTEQPLFGLLGEPRVSVLQLNLSLMSSQ